jgi:phage-related protein (TIGR01555 family)
MDDLKKIAAEQQAHVNSIGDFVNMVQSGSNTGTAALSQLQAFGWNNRYNSLTLNRSLVSEMYQEHGVVQVIVDQPVDDAFRGGIELKIPEFSDEDIKKLEYYINTQNILLTYAQACKYARLYGGAGIIINAGQDEREPFNIRKVKEWTPLEFYAADRWELSYTADGMGVDQFRDNKIERPYNYYGHVLHKTNVIKIDGKEAPSLLRGQFGGWGVSELERLVRSYNQYLKHQNVAYEMLDEAKLDIYKIEGFNSAMATPRGPQLTAQRIQYANMVKNYENALVIDKEDEYEQKSFSFAGLAEILREIRIGLACDCRFPVDKLFGQSASGFASGEDSIENYNCMVENEVRSKIKGGLIEMLEICCQKLFGYVPENRDFEWKSLRIMSSQEDSLVKTDNLNRITTTYQNGLITSEKAVELINIQKIFGTDISSAEALSLEEITEITGGTQADLSVAKASGRSGRV